MNDTEQLITQAIELEGLLRVARDRNDCAALVMARAKATAIAAALEPASEAPSITGTPVESASEEPATPLSAPYIPGTDEETDTAAALTAQSTYATAAPCDLRRYMTINDKFRFRRELFGGSDEELNDTLDLLSSMRSMEEVEEYLFDDLAWDRSDAVVKEFRSIVAGAFNPR